MVMLNNQMVSNKRGMISLVIVDKAILVGGLKPFETYESQVRGLFPIYGKNMFQTTNQNN